MTTLPVASRSFATICPGLFLFRRSDVIESLLPRGGIDLHTDWIRNSQAGQRLWQAEAEAMAARRGLWQDKQPMPPWDWRKAGKTK